MSRYQYGSFCGRQVMTSGQKVGDLLTLLNCGMRRATETCGLWMWILFRFSLNNNKK